MRDEEFKELCAKHGVSCIDARKHLRTSGLKFHVSSIIIEMREALNLTYNEIAMHMGYLDRSGARQAYLYAKQLKQKQ